MKEHPDERAPAEMPKDLGRVYAVLEAPTEPAPEALLERILDSRAGGRRAVLPVERPRSWLLRRRLLHGVIAAGLGLVALASWSRWLRPTVGTPKTTTAESFGVPMGDDFGFATLASAQSSGSSQAEPTPKFAPMAFDTSRLRPVQLRYLNRIYDNGKPVNQGTVAYSLTRSSQPGREWVLVMERTMGDETDSAFLTDTVMIERSTLRVLTEVYRVTYHDGRRAFYRWTVGDTTITQHSELQVRGRPQVSSAAGSAQVDSTTAAAQGTRNAPSRQQPAEQTGANTAVHLPDTVLTHDTVYRLSSSRYPRVVSAMNYGAEVLFRLMATPLGAGWKRSLVITRPGGTVVKEAVYRAVIPLNLELVGEDPCDSPNGKAACWKLIRRTQPEYTYLIRKSDGVLISSRIAGKFNGRKIRVEMVLIEER